MAAVEVEVGESLMIIIEIVGIGERIDQVIETVIGEKIDQVIETEEDTNLTDSIQCNNVSISYLSNYVSNLHEEIAMSAL